MDKSREQFEAWLESEDGKALMAYSDNHSIAEAAWQASRAAVEIKLPEIQWDINFDGSQHYECDDVKDCLADAGLKVKQ